MDRFKYLLRGIIVSYAITIALILLFAVLLVNTNIKEQYINTVIMIISGISILSGTTISTIKIKKYGIVNGLAISATYITILYVCSSLLNGNFSINLSTVAITIIGIGLGVLGGIAGVNIKS